MPGPEADRDLLISVAREAGALAREFFGRRITSWDKSKGNPVSEADLAVDSLLSTRLRAARPTYGWLSEETPDDGSRLSAGPVFIVDPIDGTLSFLKGKPEWTIALAVVAAGRPVAGAVFNPMTDELYAAAEGAGTTLNGRPVRVSARAGLAGCRIIAPRTLFAHPAWPVPWPEMHIETRGSLALRLALVAAGTVDAMLGLSAKHDWDLAAAHLLVTEAGGLISSHTGAPLLYAGPVPRQPSVVAGGPALHAALLARVGHVKLQT